MIQTDEDALICDLAETYRIYDYKQLPLKTVAVFASGLKDDSRIKIKMSNQLVSLETMLLASIHDKLSKLVWFQTKDGQKNKNRPKSLVDSFRKQAESNNKDMITFDSGEDFTRVRQRIIQNRGE